MKKNLFFIAIILVIAVSSCVKDKSVPAATPIVTPSGDTLIYYWSFNNQDSSIHTPDFSAVSGNASFSYSAAYIDYTGGSVLNLQGTTDSGQCLRVRNPAQSLTFAMPTTGFDSVSMSFSIEASSSGPSINGIAYTTDGIHYITAALANAQYNVTTSFALQTFNFSTDPNVNNNPKFAVQITFANNNNGTSGNDRIDNVTLSGVRK